MGYLLPADYEAYGLAAETADELVTMASALMEAHCRRPTLLAASYVERVRLSEGAQMARLSYGPLLPGAVTAVRVRYGQGRRGEMLSGERILCRGCECVWRGGVVDGAQCGDGGCVCGREGDRVSGELSGAAL